MLTGQTLHLKELIEVFRWILEDRRQQTRAESEIPPYMQGVTKQKIGTAVREIDKLRIKASFAGRAETG